MPKAAKALMNQRPPKRVKNDAFEQVNDLVERHRGTTRVASNEWGDAIGGPGGAKPQRENEFPVRINKPNRQRDTRLRLKAQYEAQRRAGGGLDIGKAELNDGDLSAFSDIEKQKQIVGFDSWMSSYLNMSDPATAKLVDDIMPEYWEKRMEVIENQAELQKNIALIRLRGPQTKKDFMIVYMLQTGQLPLPQGAVFEPKTWSYDNKNFNRGLLNPNRHMPEVVETNKMDPIGGVMAASRRGFGNGVNGNAALVNIGGLGVRPGPIVKQELTNSLLF